MNLNRLVRSASNEQSDLTVSQFIEQHKRNEHEL